jgi:PAS domain S-box-containing protein
LRAENALFALTSGHADAIVGPGEKTYLLDGAREHLRKCENGLQALIDSASDLITVVNRAGDIVSRNRAVIRFLGCEQEDLLGKNLFGLIHFDDMAKVRSFFFRVIDGFRDETTIEFRHLTGDGSYRLLEAVVTKLRDPSVSPVVLISREISCRKKPSERDGP